MHVCIKVILFVMPNALRLKHTFITRPSIEQRIFGFGAAFFCFCFFELDNMTKMRWFVSSGLEIKLNTAFLSDSSWNRELVALLTN